MPERRLRAEAPSVACGRRVSHALGRPWSSGSGSLNAAISGSGSVEINGSGSSDTKGSRGHSACPIHAFARLAAWFDRTWGSDYAEVVVPGKVYEPRRR